MIRQFFLLIAAGALLSAQEPSQPPPPEPPKKDEGKDPAAPPPQGETKPQPPPTPQGGSKRILVKIAKLFQDPGDKAFPETIKISHIGKIAMVVQTKDGKHRVINTGKEHKPYPFILSMEQVAAVRSAQSARRAGNNSQPPDFSNLLRFGSDQQTVYYPAYTGKGYVISWDTSETAMYDYIMQDMPIFSPDGKTIAFVARKGGRWHIVINQKDTGEYDDMQIGTLVFSPDSKRYAFSAFKGGAWRVYLETTSWNAFEGIAEGTPVFSPDSKKVAFVAFTRQNKQVVVFDGQPIGEFDIVADRSLQFSPDSKECTFAAQIKKAWYVYQHAKQFGPYEEVLEGMPVYNKDGKRLVWAAKLNGVWTVYENGKPLMLPGEEVKGKKPKPIPMASNVILRGTPKFSQDGKRLAVGLKRDGKWTMWLDGWESGKFEEIKPDSITFTSDCSKFIFVGTRDKKYVPVINDKELPPCSDIGPIRISRGEGTGTVAFCVKKTRTPEEVTELKKQKPDDKGIGPDYWMVVVNGEERYGPYHEMLPLTLTVARNGQRFAFPAREKDVWGIFADGELRTENLPFWIRFHPDTNLLEIIAVTEDGWYVLIHEVME
ncbi:MAG TPA: hypothetical protein VI643_05480 [Planctomycetota bacterium]|nr:hypothetical protein [Planctomycetota bacterium]